MKNQIASAMLALTLTGPLAAAQTGDRLVVESSPARIAAARSPYTRPDDVAADASAHVTLAQFPGRQPGPPFSRYGGYPRPNYPGMWRVNGSGRHAAIGFGIGAALGAKANKDPTPGTTVKASMLVGSVVGVLGALIGQGAPPYARLQRPRERGTDKRRTDQDWTGEDEMASRPNQTDSDASKRTSAREAAPELKLAARPSNSTPASADTPATP